MGNILDYEKITFVDVETTHLDPRRGEIIQIAILTEDRKGNVETYETKIKPYLPHGSFSEKALEINGYNEKDWQDAPRFKDVAPEIVKRLSRGPIVAHNALFDITYIENALVRFSDWEKGNFTFFNDKIFRIGYPIIDTVALAYVGVPTQKQNLNALREHFEISQEGAHEALKDVKDCRQVFWHCVDRILNK